MNTVSQDRSEHDLNSWPRECECSAKMSKQGRTGSVMCTEGMRSSDMATLVILRRCMQPAMQVTTMYTAKRLNGGVKARIHMSEHRYISHTPRQAVLIACARCKSMTKREDLHASDGNELWLALALNIQAPSTHGYQEQEPEGNTSVAGGQ